MSHITRHNNAGQGIETAHGTEHGSHAGRGIGVTRVIVFESYTGQRTGFMWDEIPASHETVSATLDRISESHGKRHHNHTGQGIRSLIDRISQSDISLTGWLKSPGESHAGQGTGAAQLGCWRHVWLDNRPLHCPRMPDIGEES